MDVLIPTTVFREKSKYMFEIDELAKAGLQGWPLVAAIGIVCVCFVAWWNGDWPWSGIITHNHYHGKDEETEENDE